MLAKRISKNFVMLFTGNVISQAIVFFGLIKVAGALTPEDFGRFSFAQAISTFFVRFTEFGTETVGVRRITQHDNDAFVLENVFFARTMLSLFVIGAAFIVRMLFSKSQDADIIFIMLISLIGISLSLEWFYQAHERMEIVSIIRTVRALLFVLPFLGASAQFHTDVFVSWLHSFSFIIVAALFGILYLRRNRFAVSAITMKKIVPLLKESAPIGIAITLMQIPYNYNTFIIGVTMSKEDVGAFSAAYRPVLAFWSFGIIAAYQAFFPVVNSLVHDMEAFRAFAMKLTRIFMVSGLLLVLTIAPFGEIIVEVLYGPKYYGTGYILQLSLIIIAIVLGRAVIEYSLVSLKKQKEYLKGMMFVSTLYVILCWLGAVAFGIVGVIAASIFSEVLYSWYIFRQVRAFGRWEEYLSLVMKAALVGVLSYAVFLIPSGLHFAVKLLIMYGVFFAGVWTSKMISISELLSLKALLRR
ncbi:MAG: oligosaccharide flippase family protein [Acidobacteriota bacterium]